MAEFPILPLKVADLLADTNHMRPEEFGAYCRILFTMWQQGGRLLECDLLKISELSSYKFSRSREKICRPLTIIEGTVSQKRLEDTRLKVLDKRAKARVSVSHRRDRQPGYDRITDVLRTNLRNAYETPTTKIRKKEEELTPTVLLRAREPAEPNTPVPPPSEDPMKIPLAKIARRMSEQQSLQAQQIRKEAAADSQLGWQRVDEMPLSEIAERAAAKREADEALAEAKRRKLNGSHEPAPAAARSA